MTWIGLKSMAERRVRAVLTALAIVLGVAMVAGSLILTDTIDRAFTNIFSSTYTQTDLVVRGDPVVDDAFAGTPTVSADLLPRIQALPGVEAATGSLVDFSGTGNTAKILGRDGEVIGGNMPSFGFGVDPSQERFNHPLEQATTTSLDALRSFSAGMLVYQTNSPAAEPHFRRAVEIDPNFARAWAQLGSYYATTGQQALSAESFRKAYELRNRISEFERLLDEVSRDDRGQIVARTYLTSETGKVYTMLAHAAGRFD